MNLNSIKLNEFACVYVTSQTCNVCKSIYPRLLKLMSNYPNCNFSRIEIEEFPEAAGEFMSFTVPTLVLFSSGKELFRASRFIDLLILEEQLEKYYKMIF